MKEINPESYICYSKKNWTYLNLYTMAQSLYPLKFKTIFKDKIWGGRKIRDILNKDFEPLPNCGETWELSGVEGNISIVSEGALKGENLAALLEKYKEELVGKRVYETYGATFPLLVKFIDANDDLSIQVHPNDEQAKKYNSFGKTEMWYIIQAEEDATLITGFNQDVTKEEFRKYMAGGTLEQVLNKEEVNPDDVFFIPAGRIHTIGKGILLAEIQQSSDITFRVYDFNRKDARGNLRELHVEEAIEVIDYNTYPEYKSNKPAEKNTPTALVEGPYFITNRLVLDEKANRDYNAFDSFVIYTCLEGNATLLCNQGELKIAKGEVVLLPATIKEVQLIPNPECKLLETYIA
jgi:mannose-6-phosphate isomerase